MFSVATVQFCGIKKQLHVCDYVACIVTVFVGQNYMRGFPLEVFLKTVLVTKGWM